MPVGELKTILVCQPSGTPAAPCPAGEAPASLQAYVIDPASQGFFDTLNTPYDYERGAALWAWGFVFIMTLALVSRAIGYVIETLKSRQFWGHP